MVVIIGLIALAVIGIGTLVIGSYTVRWNNRLVKSASRLLPYPAVVVNNHWNSYFEFLDGVATLEYSYSQPEVLQESGLTAKPSRQEIEALVLDRMAKDDVVRQLAERYGITVTQATLDAEMKKLIDQTGSAEDVTNRIQQLYGWSLETFAQRVVRPFLVRQRLQEKIAADDGLNAEQLKRIESLLERVKAGKDDFRAIAREVNEDVTKQTDGDLGVFGRGERDEAIEQAGFALAVGETSGVVRTVDGFHILKLLETIPADDKSGTPEKIHPAHIFVAARQLDSWLFEQSKNQRVRVLLSGYSWDAANARVQRPGAGTSAGQ